MNDEFEDNDLDLDDSSFDEFEEKSGSLGSTINNNPLLKIGLIVGAVVLVFVLVTMLGGKDTPLDQSLIATAPDVSAPPGTEAASQEYIDAIQEVNERNVEIAEATGTSALPTPIEPPVGVLTVPEQEVDEEDPLQRWRRLQEERLQRELQQAQTIEPTALPDDTARQEQLQRLADAMSSQMQAVLDSKQNQISYLSISNLEDLEEELGIGTEGNSNSPNETFDDGELEEEIIQEVLLPAGEIEYAQLLIEANTDAPGPVLAQIMSGPLKGGKLIGSFANQEEYLTLNFSTLVLNDETLSINAIALDTETTLPGLATEVDKRYFSRVLLPAAAAFVTEFADALAESGNTTVTVSGETVIEEEEELDTDEAVANGISAVGETLEEVLDEETDGIEPLIRVAPGTPMGVLFTESVVTQDEAI